MAGRESRRSETAESGRSGRGSGCFTYSGGGTGAGSAAGGLTCTFVVVPSQPASNKTLPVTKAHFLIRCFITTSPLDFPIARTASRHPNHKPEEARRENHCSSPLPTAAKRLRVPPPEVNGLEVPRVDRIRTRQSRRKLCRFAHLRRFGTALYHHFRFNC
jgi:hypothetical protein